MNRRNFIEAVGVAAFASRLSGAAGYRKINRIGVQLYTVRDLLKKDFEGTLARVAKIGYKEVEFAQYFEDPLNLQPVPKKVREILDRDGLSAPAGHVPFKLLSPETWPRVLEAAKILGFHYIVNPSIDRDLLRQPDGWKRAAETFNRAGAESQKAGIQLAYHNHVEEFKPLPDGKLPYDVLLAASEPKLLKMELDLGWAHEAHADPLKYFAMYPGRFPLVHVKDFDRDDKMTEVGSGVIEWKQIFAKSTQAGIRHYFVEHDEPKSPFESIQTSYQYLQKLRF
jgi:sugar phosphate isomerase/epimerase